MSEQENIELQRDVNVTLVPDGTQSVLKKGDIVTIYQQLGGNFTVTSEPGGMSRIAGSDADALGKEPVQIETLTTDTDPESVEQNAWEVMKTVYDPEIPVNIVDLGLVYYCTVTPSDNGCDVKVAMTLTAPGCGMGPVLQNDVEKNIEKLPGVEHVDVEVVFEPPWSRDMMSEAAKVQLNMF